MRLYGSDKSNQGIIQINLNGVWGTVCDRNFNMVAANVTCRQLNFVGAERVQFNSVLHAAQVTPSLIGSVRCIGDEGALSYCDFSLPADSCPRNNTVGIICINKTCK